MLTLAELKQITEYLSHYGIKDSQLQSAQPLTGGEYIALVQNGENKITPLEQANEYMYEKVLDYISDTKFTAQATPLGDNDFKLEFYSNDKEE